MRRPDTSNINSCIRPPCFLKMWAWEILEIKPSALILHSYHNSAVLLSVLWLKLPLSSIHMYKVKPLHWKPFGRLYFLFSCVSLSLSGYHGASTPQRLLDQLHIYASACRNRMHTQYRTSRWKLQTCLYMCCVWHMHSYGRVHKCVES